MAGRPRYPALRSGTALGDVPHRRNHTLGADHAAPRRRTASPRTDTAPRYPNRPRFPIPGPATPREAQCPAGRETGKTARGRAALVSHFSADGQELLCIVRQTARRHRTIFCELSSSRAPRLRGSARRPAPPGARRIAPPGRGGVMRFQYVKSSSRASLEPGAGGDNDIRDKLRNIYHCFVVFPHAGGEVAARTRNLPKGAWHGPSPDRENDRGAPRRLGDPTSVEHGRLAGLPAPPGARRSSLLDLAPDPAEICQIL